MSANLRHVAFPDSGDIDSPELQEARCHVFFPLNVGAALSPLGTKLRATLSHSPGQQRRT